MKARLSVSLAVALALACSGGGPGGGPTGTPPGTPPAPIPPPPPTQPPPSPPPSENRVEPPIGSVANFDIVDDSFVDEDGNHDQEARATVKVGEMVSWTQNGQHIHRVEFNQMPSGADAPDSGDLRPRSTFQFRPKATGQYVFFCRYHEYMMDVVITVEAGS